MVKRRYSPRGWSVALALAGLGASPAAAQDNLANATVVTPAPAPAPDTVGPEQLRDFSLPGTVTRRTEPPVANSVAPRAAEPEAERPAPARPAPRPSAIRPVAPPVARSVTIALPPPDPLTRRPTLAPPIAETTAPPAVSSSGASDAVVAPPPDMSGSSGFSRLPWLVALMALMAAAVAFAWRKRSARAFGYAGGIDEAPDNAFVAPPPAPPGPGARYAQPAPAPPRGDGIVSIRLRPWIAIEFAATRAVITDDNATVHFDILLYNSGSAPAREVLVEGRMFNAGPEQDREIANFFENPVAKGDTIAQIPPLSRVELKSAVSMPRASCREYQVDGRRLFVPLVGFNVLYRFGSGEGQTSASFIVGRGGEDGGKMAPLRFDLGPRIFRGLGQREHNVGVRR